jgi:hypothetical protein
MSFACRRWLIQRIHDFVFERGTGNVGASMKHRCYPYSLLLAAVFFAVWFCEDLTYNCVFKGERHWRNVQHCWSIHHLLHKAL